MIKLVDYTDNYYSKLKSNLEQAGLFDEKRDNRNVIRKTIQHDSKSIILAIDDGRKLVGSVYAFYHPWGSRIFRLAVEKSYRSKGIGSSLMEEAERRIKQRGGNIVSLLIKNGDERLQKYYSQMGYIPTKTKNHNVMYKFL